MRRMDESEFKKLVKPDSYQVFLFTCPATFPYSFARHPWFVVNRKGVLSRWEIFWRPAYPHLLRWGHLHKDFYPPLQGIEKYFLSHEHFWKTISLVGCVEGGEGSLAHEMAKYIEDSGETYPYCREYSLKGPNSNTYVQWVLNRFPDCTIRLPWNAIGKRYKMARTA